MPVCVFEMMGAGFVNIRCKIFRGEWELFIDFRGIDHCSLSSVLYSVFNSSGGVGVHC